MKKAKTFILVFVILIFAACNQKTDEFIQKQKLSESLANGTAVEYFPGLIPLGCKVYDFGFFQEEYTLNDLDDYYRNEVPEHQGELYYDNLRSVAIGFMINLYDMTNSGDYDMLEYYLDELEDIKNPFHFEDYIVCLKAMQGKWDERKIMDLAESLYNEWNQELNTYPEKENVIRERKEMNEQMKSLKSQLAVN
jgi:hypothetical protein